MQGLVLVNPCSFHRGGANRGQLVQSHGSTGSEFKVQLDPLGGSTDWLHRSVLKCTQAFTDLDHSWLVSQFKSQRSRRLQREGHCSMISLRFSCRMVSFTAWKTKRIFSVSTAVVKWWNSGFPRFLLLRLNDCTRNA